MKRTLLLCLFMGLVITITSCSDDADDNSSTEAVTGTWRIVEVTVSQQQLTQRTPSDEVISITFSADGTFTGSTSVNQFDGDYEVDGGTLTMTSFSTTEVADTVFAGAFYEAIDEALVPNQTFAQFGFSFNNLDLILVFGNSGEMVLEQQ